MPTFRYQRAGGDGSTIEAADRASALRLLVQRGITPTALEAADTGPTSVGHGASLHAGVAAGVGWRGVSGARLSRSELATLIRELSTATQAGLPLVQALRTIAKSGHSGRQRELLERVIGSIEQGKSLADAFAAEGSAFNELTINLTRAGEASGKLGEVLQQAADLLDREVKVRRSVLGATLYPMILLGLISISIVVVVTVIVPRTLKAVSSGGGAASLPLPTQVLQWVAQLFGGYWWAIIPAAGLAAYAAASAYATPALRLRFDRWVLRVPLIGRVLRDVAVARFTRTLGTLVTAGIPAVQALRVTKGTLGNRAMERVIDEVCEQVSGGRTIAEPMERSGFFPPMLVQIINLGERSGRLDQLLNQAATAFEDKTETSIKLLMTALPPILVVGLAGVVGFVVMAILLPLLEMQERLG